MKLSKAARCVEEGAGETLAYMAYPREHWTRIRTNNPLERIMREVRRRTRVVGAFPDGALMLVAGPAAARGRHSLGHAEVPRHEPPGGARPGRIFAESRATSQNVKRKSGE